MPSPASAASRCSTVPTFTPSLPRVVASEVSTTYSDRAGMLTLRSRSVRTKTIPWFAGAGTSVRLTGVPECSPTPVQVVGCSSVRWL